MNNELFLWTIFLPGSETPHRLLLHVGAWIHDVNQEPALAACLHFTHETTNIQIFDGICLKRYTVLCIYNESVLMITVSSAEKVCASLEVVPAL